ncbi:hypothetical protein M9Y10_001373 [Tritrichomonas musculus]|uniref:DUF3447 domain-containing protein n=1 Tax=Tritrichomonas musculus TaxID=1915356 RepID=A0ABR2L6Z0_9EUKA
MESDDYLQMLQKSHDILLNFLNNEDNFCSDFNKLIYQLNEFEFQSCKKNMKFLLYILCQISKNHYRTQELISTIEKILLFYKKEIIEFFSDAEIFEIFKKSNRLILFLYKEGFIKIQYHVNYLVNNYYFSLFMSQEIYRFLNKQNCKRIKEMIDIYGPEVMDNFEEKRLKGENESYICSLIREDSIIEFVSYVSKTNLNLNSQIKKSFFETNSFLLKNSKTSLIEYASFFGSIQIFQFLKLNNVELTPSLWLYAIHGRNADIIHCLEESHIKPEDKTFKACLIEAIKCHHNDIAYYIQTNLLDDKNMDSYSYCFKYSNYAFIENCITNMKNICTTKKWSFSYMFLIDVPEFDINSKII